MKCRPLNDRVLVQRCESDEKTPGGLYLPDSRAKPNKGKVLAVGPGKLLDDGTRAPMSVKKGDTVLFSHYAGSEVESAKKKNEEILAMREDEILAVEDED